MKLIWKSCVDPGWNRRDYCADCPNTVSLPSLPLWIQPSHSSLFPLLSVCIPLSLSELLGHHFSHLQFSSFYRSHKGPPSWIFLPLLLPFLSDFMFAVWIRLRQHSWTIQCWHGGKKKEGKALKRERERETKRCPWSLQTLKIKAVLNVMSCREKERSPLGGRATQIMLHWCPLSGNPEIDLFFLRFSFLHLEWSLNGFSHSITLSQLCAVCENEYLQ